VLFGNPRLKGALDMELGLKVCVRTIQANVTLLVSLMIDVALGCTDRTVAVVGDVMVNLASMFDDKEQRELLTRLLRLFPPASRLGTALLKAIAQQTPVFAVEVGVFKRIAGVDHIWMVERAVDDEYAGLLHSPGTLVWAEDGGGLQATVRRLAKREYGSEDALRLLTQQPINVSWGPTIRWPVEGSQAYLTELNGDPPADKGRWVPVADALMMSDEVIIKEHRDNLLPVMYRTWLELQMQPLTAEELKAIVEFAVNGDGAVLADYPAETLLRAAAQLKKLVASGGALDSARSWPEVEGIGGYHGPRTDE